MPPIAPMVFAFIGVPLAIIIGEVIFHIYLNSAAKGKQDVGKCVVQALALIFASMEASFLTIGFTDLTKMLVGEQRPHYLEKLTSDGLESATRDSVSFPSGHASTSFNAGIFIFAYVLFLYYRIRQVPVTEPSWLWRELRSLYLYLAILPVILAGFIGISRIVDYHHHFWDVIAGALYGGFFAGATFLSCIISNSAFFGLTAERQTTDL